jgi:F0F1-type ATP synthase membrane subunit b/b'
MPQFDFYSFSGQNFWFLLSFSILYFFILYFYLANFSEMFKMRQKLISFYYNNDIKSNNTLLNLYDFFISVKK